MKRGNHEELLKGVITLDVLNSQKLKKMRELLWNGMYVDMGNS